MDTVYTICIVVGFSIPLITLILGGIFDASVDTDGDGPDMGFDFGFDIGDISISLLPASIHSICVGLMLFGAMGKILDGSLKLWMVVLIAVAVGYVGAVIIQSFIRTLRKVEHTTISREDLVGCDGHVVNTIIAGGFGSVSVTTFDGITTNYPAKADNPTQVIRQGSVVTIVRVEKNEVIVRPKDMAEKYRLGDE
ncbi:MAG: hypothetical protein IK125_04170 [Lachnospiraceae bacterium]|nr:hypothetical protein [Lachnospiraceae bacterium]